MNAALDMANQASLYGGKMPLNTVAKWVTGNWSKTAPPSALASFNSAVNRTYDAMLSEGSDPEDNRSEFWKRVRTEVR